MPARARARARFSVCVIVWVLLLPVFRAYSVSSSFPFDRTDRIGSNETAHVVGFELDPDAIAVARSNVEAMDLEEDVDIVHCDVRRVPVRLGEGGVSGAAGAGKGVVAAAAAESASAAGRGQPSALAEEEQSEQQQRQEGREQEAEAPGGAGENLFDTALMNPPFGTRQKGVDMAFLRAGLDAVRGGGGAVYSMHKTSTRDFIAKTCKRWWVPRGDEIVREERMWPLCLRACARALCFVLFVCPAAANLPISQTLG